MAAAALNGDPLRLDGRRALVTGASRGIGRATAACLAAAGAKVALNCSRSLDDADAAVEEIRRDGGVAERITGDVSDADAVRTIFARIDELWGGIDILVNNAAITRDGYLMMMSPEAWDEVINVNLRAAFLTSRQALRSMIRGKWGRIVNVISPAALWGKDGAANYAASKGGLLSMSKSLAREVGRYGITVNCVCPGFVETRMIEGMPEEQRKLYTQQIALGRFGEPGDVGNAIRFLASPAAAYVTGTVLSVDGGLVG